MKNQYFGDINDYRKYGLLRVLSGKGKISVGVCWMLTADDGSTDGGFRNYGTAPDKWQQYDAELFICLCRCEQGVSEAQKFNLLPFAKYWPELLEDNANSRKSYFRQLKRAFAGVDLVFFDPDNGFEVKSRPYGRKHSSKYLYWHELEKCFKMRCSVLVYQHFCREERVSFIKRLAKEIHQYTKAKLIYSFRTPRVVFFLAPQPRHHSHFAKMVTELQLWEDQITPDRHTF